MYSDLITKTRQSFSLLETISKWPDWKLKALCLDESDLQIMEVIKAYRQSINE